MSLFTELYSVNQREKIAGARGFSPVIPQLAGVKLALWRRMKLAAARDPQGVAVGLARLVIKHASERLASGEKLASENPKELISMAASIGCAHATDLAIEKMASNGELTNEEAAKLALLNVESVFYELGSAFKAAEINNSLCTHGSDVKKCNVCSTQTLICSHGRDPRECKTCSGDKK